MSEDDDSRILTFAEAMGGNSVEYRQELESRMAQEVQSRPAPSVVTRRHHRPNPLLWERYGASGYQRRTFGSYVSIVVVGGIVVFTVLAIISGAILGFPS